MNATERVFAGTLRFTTDNFLLAPFGNGPFLDVSFPFTDGALDGQSVSILGHMGERVITGSITTPSIIGRKVIAQKAIELKAFEISISPGAGSAFDNWLRAERELLGV